MAPCYCRHWALTVPLAHWPLVLHKLDVPIIVVPLATSMDSPLSLFLVSKAHHAVVGICIWLAESKAPAKTLAVGEAGKSENLSSSFCHGWQALPIVIKSPSDRLPQLQKVGSDYREPKGCPYAVRDTHCIALKFCLLYQRGSKMKSFNWLSIFVTPVVTRSSLQIHSFNSHHWFV